MMVTTENLNLTLLEQTDMYDINVINENLRKIDIAIGKIAKAVNINVNDEGSD